MVSKNLGLRLQLVFIFLLISIKFSDGNKTEFNKTKLKLFTKPKNYQKIILEARKNDTGEELPSPDDDDTVAVNETTIQNQNGTNNNTEQKWAAYEMIVQIDANYTPEQREKIQAAIFDLQTAMKCFKFFMVNSSEVIPDDVDYLFIKREEAGACHSNLGRQGGRQELIITDSCPRPYGTTLHEIMHVLGFYHEHVRPDRDQYIKINWDDPSFNENEAKKKQFELMENRTSFAFTYDYGSIMHYKFNDIMQPIKEVPPGVIPGQRSQLSKTDISRLNYWYSCASGAKGRGFRTKMKKLAKGKVKFGIGIGK